MLGKIYAQYPEILATQMAELGLERKLSFWQKRLASLYLKIFGVPEIGFQIRALALKKGLKGLNPKKILDAGCGLGIQANYLAQKFPQARIEAFDTDPQMVRTCQRVIKNRNIKFFQADINQLKIKGQYDLIVCIDVLEHLDDWQKGLENLVKRLKTGGVLLLHTPLGGQRRHFKRFLVWEHDTHRAQGLVEKELIAWLKNHQLSIIKHEGDHRFFGSLAWELHMMAMKSFILGAIGYPLFLGMMFLDEIFKTKKYNCLLLLAQK